MQLKVMSQMNSEAVLADCLKVVLKKKLLGHILARKTGTLCYVLTQSKLLPINLYQLARILPLALLDIALSTISNTEN